jgi:hypothetical protein
MGQQTDKEAEVEQWRPEQRRTQIGEWLDLGPRKERDAQYKVEWAFCLSPRPGFSSVRWPLLDEFHQSGRE